MLLKTANGVNTFFQKVRIKRLMDDTMMMVMMAGVRCGGGWQGGVGYDYLVFFLRNSYNRFEALCGRQIL
jgi:hypothetical protein